MVQKYRTTSHDQKKRFKEREEDNEGFKEGFKEGAQDPVKETAKYYPDQSISMGIIVLITAIYCAMKYNAEDATIVSYIVYGLALIFSQLFMNLNLTNKLCGVSQWSTTILVTFIPWTMIFGALGLILYKFPGWLKPFSNTFGYAIASMMGLDKVFDKILKSDIPEDNYLAQMYNDSTNKSLLINEIPPSSDGFANFIKNLKSTGLLNPDLTDLTDLSIIELKRLIRLKNVVAEFMWYSLTGILTTLVSYNYIINAECLLSAEDIDRSSEVLQSSVKRVTDITKGKSIF